MNRFKIVLSSALFGLLSVSPASALTLTFDEFSTSSNNPATGASGLVELIFSDVAGAARVDATVTNTTDTTSFGAGATASKLTGFGFDLLSGVAFAGTFVAGTFLDETLLNAAFNPFGSLDLAFADNSNFLGGNANSALPEGQQDTFSFGLSLGGFGNAAGLEAAFSDAFSNSGLNAGLRFQQVNADAGSDKLLLGTQIAPVPLPATGLLLIGALGGIGLVRRRRKA